MTYHRIQRLIEKKVLTEEEIERRRQKGREADKRYNAKRKKQGLIYVSPEVRNWLKERRNKKKFINYDILLRFLISDYVRLKKGEKIKNVHEG